MDKGISLMIKTVRISHPPVKGRSNSYVNKLFNVLAKIGILDDYYLGLQMTEVKVIRRNYD